MTKMPELILKFWNFTRHLKMEWSRRREKERWQKLANRKQHPYELETLNSGYLYDAQGEYAQYRIECRLIYTQEV